MTEIRFRLSPVGSRPLFSYMPAENAQKEAVVARVTEIAERVGAPEGIEIVDVEFKGAGKRRVLRIFIDRPGGVSHAECEFISRNVGTILDVEDVVPGGSYILEVSSPGLERPLKKAADYERFRGRQVKIVVREPVAGRRTWKGTLAGLDGGVVTLETREGSSVQVELAQIQRANLTFEW